TDTPANTSTHTTNDAAQRPPRYANFEIGLVNSIWYVSRWKSRRIDVPKMAEMMITPKSPAASWLNATAYGPLSSTLPLLNPIGPKLSEPVQKKPNASHARK